MKTLFAFTFSMLTVAFTQLAIGDIIVHSINRSTYSRAELDSLFHEESLSATGLTAGSLISFSRLEIQDGNNDMYVEARTDQWTSYQSTAICVEQWTFVENILLDVEDGFDPQPVYSRSEAHFDLIFSVTGNTEHVRVLGDAGFGLTRLSDMTNLGTGEFDLVPDVYSLSTHYEHELIGFDDTRNAITSSGTFITDSPINYAIPEPSTFWCIGLLCVAWAASRRTR